MSIPTEIFEGLKLGSVIPYLGPGMLDLIPGGTPVPGDPEGLAGVLTARASVPHKIRKRLTASAQFIENFKHRKTLVGLMADAYKTNVSPSAFHLQLASLALPLIVDTWYDDAMPGALARAVGDAPKGWGQVQGLSQSEHFGTWYGYYSSNGAAVPDYTPGQWKTLLYKPIGGHVPADNYLVSDTDYVEVLTEIDIQTPIPQDVQTLRVGRHFLFLGCRFNDQLTRSFARQIMKRSSDTHWAVLPDELTRTEARFITEQKIQRLPITLSEFATLLREQLQPEAA